MFGRGRGFGRGFWGRGFWWGGRGNPFPFCRFFPWLPRWWWAIPYYTMAYPPGPIPNVGYYYPTFPYPPTPLGYGYGSYPTTTPPQTTTRR